MIKSARQSKQLTQSKLAEILGITTRYLKAIENSGRIPSYNLFVRIVHELDISAVTIHYPEYVETVDLKKTIHLRKVP